MPRTGISPLVTSVDLSGNQLTMLTSGSLVALRNVVRLKLDNNEIERIVDGAFEQTPSLQNLHISANNLTEVALSFTQYTYRRLAVWRSASVVRRMNQVALL